MAEVDCIGAGRSKCDDVGVEAFPTLKLLGFLDDRLAWRGMEIRTSCRTTGGHGAMRPWRTSARCSGAMDVGFSRRTWALHVGRSVLSCATRADVGTSVYTARCVTSRDL